MQTNLLDIAQHVLNTEVAALQNLLQQLDETQLRGASSAMAQCRGRVVVCGMGKSGLIAKKIAATFASTGTPSFFLHPSEAIHGDLGMLMEGDVFCSISNSGETDEILQLVPHIQRLGLTHITMVGNPNSTLARYAQYVLNIGVLCEVSTIQSVPMASCVTTLAMGDVLATILIKLKDFQSADFAKLHPGGSLGRRLLLRVQDIMHQTALPTAHANDLLKDVIVQMTASKLGLVAVCDDTQRVIGIITDGDLRRALNTHDAAQLIQLQAASIMTHSPKTIAPSASLQEADDLMHLYKITALLVVENDALVGIVANHQIR